MTCTVQQETSTDGRLSWFAEVDGEVILHWLALDVPDDGLDIVSVPAKDVAESDVREATAQLLPMVLAVAHDASKACIHCLVSDQTPTLFGPSLNECGFRPNVVLQTWMTDRLASVDEDSDVRVQTWSITQEELGEEVVTAWVEGCLKDSEDLTGMDAPTAEQLLDNWSHLPHLTSCILMDNARPVGLALVTFEPDNHLATLEYLGVIQSKRRQGLGQLLLDQVCGIVMTPQAYAEGQQLMVYCDTLNTPAMALYRSNGFSRQDSHTLWIRSEKTE